jgi:hypothetical protein
MASIDTENSMEPVERANELAATLARRGVDPSEVAGVFRHLRAFLDQAAIDGAPPDQGVDYWWRWLATIAGPGLATVQRSNQTEAYYSEIYAACERNLRELPPSELAQTLGWAVRLTRYHRLANQGGARAASVMRPATPTPVAPPPAPIDPDRRQVNDLLYRLNEMPNNRVASELDRFITAWRALTVDAALKREVAQAILQKVRDAGREKASKSKTWYQELEASLQDPQ